MKIVKPNLGPEVIGLLQEKTLEVLTREGAPSDRRVRNILKECVEVAAGVAAPAGLYTSVSVLSNSEEGVWTSFGLIESPMFSRVVESCDKPKSLIFSVATIGHEFDRELKRERPLFHRLVMDAVGSELAEIVASMIEEDWVREFKKEGLDTSMRSSPGYCDWPLEGQKVLFGGLDAGAVGVELLPSFAMVPLKSISSVAVSSVRVPVRSACVFCSEERCRWRRI